MLGLSLPASSLSDQAASLRAVPDRSRTRLPKRLIRMVLSVIARAVCALRSNFLPELREALQRGRRVEAAAELPERRDDLAIGRFGEGLQGFCPHASQRPEHQSEPGHHGVVGSIVDDDQVVFAHRHVDRRESASHVFERLFLPYPVAAANP